MIPQKILLDFCKNKFFVAEVITNFYVSFLPYFLASRKKLALSITEWFGRIIDLGGMPSTHIDFPQGDIPLDYSRQKAYLEKLSIQYVARAGARILGFNLIRNHKELNHSQLSTLISG